MKSPLLILILGCSLVTGWAQDPELLKGLPDDVAELKLECEISRAELRKPLVALRQQYLNRLTQIRDEAQSRGVLAALLAVTNEIKRVKGESLDRGEVPESEQPGDLVSARKIYQRERQALMARFQRLEEPLVKRYHSALLAKVNELTRSEQLETAVRVKKLLEVELKNYQSQSQSLAKGTDVRPIGSPGSRATPGKLEIRAQVDGMSHLYMRGSQIWYDHSEGSNAPVGRHGGDHPSEVNGEEWRPVWEGKRTRPLDLDVSLPKYDPPATVRSKVLDGRGTIVIVEQPSAENEYTLKVAMRDRNEAGKGFFGSEWLEFRLTW